LESSSHHLVTILMIEEFVRLRTPVFI